MRSRVRRSKKGESKNEKERQGRGGMRRGEEKGEVEEGKGGKEGRGRGKEKMGRKVVKGAEKLRH